MEDFRIDLEALPKYPTGRELATLTGRPLKWVQRQILYLGIEPVLLLGERQFSRADALRLVLLSHLQRRLGETSPTPRLLVEAATPAISDLLRNPHGPTLPVAAGQGHPPADALDQHAVPVDLSLVDPALAVERARKFGGVHERRRCSSRQG